MLKRPRFDPCVSLGITLLLIIGPARAAGQDRPSPQTVLKPIEVLVTRRPEAPHDVAASVEVISGADLLARGANTLRDALSLAAGVSIAPGGDGGPASSVPEFWGLREFDAFLLVVDNVPWGGALNPAIATASLRDVERIEILRGPAPVTFGATSFVGVIHVVHKAAAERSRYLDAHGGSFGSGGVGLDLPLAPGSWNGRASADFDHGGFRDDNTAYSRSHVLWRVSSPGGVWLKSDVTILRQDPASPHPRQGPTLSTAVPLDANHNPDGARLEDNSFNVSGGWQKPILNGVTWGTTASLTHSSQDMFRGFLTDATNSADNASGFKEEIEINDVYVDSHLLWGGESSMRFLTGADLLVARGEAKGATFTYTAPLNGQARAQVAEPSTLNLASEDERAFLGAYGSLDWSLGSRFNANAGVRLNSTTEKRGEGKDVTHSRLSGSAGALLKLWEAGVNHVRAFVNYRNTFKPAAFDFGLSENEGVLEPETSAAYEAGLKVRTMEGRLDLEASVFRTDFENLVTSTVVNNLPALVNSGTTRFKGVELAADLRLPHAAFARASYSFHDGRFVDFVQSFDGVPTQLAGKRFEMSPRNLASLGITLAPDRGLIASASFSYTGDRQLTKRNTALAPAFSTWDASIGYRMDRTEFRIDGRNLSDRRDPVSESEFGDAQYYRMTPRTVRIGMLVRY